VILTGRKTANNLIGQFSPANIDQANRWRRRMSRAFVNEDSPDANLDDAPEIKIPIPAGSRNYLTPEGAAALVAELTDLETQTRPGLMAELERWSKSGGDAERLSVVRHELAKANRRLQYLGRMSALAEMVEAPANGYPRVGFGAAVLVRGEDGAERRYRIVGVDEADPARGWISWLSPIAKALRGKRPGETVTVRLPESSLNLTLVAVE
jgi:transcription elongation factor GreB